MKQFLLITAILFSLQSFSQVNVEEVNATMSQGVNRGFKVLIPETDLKTAQKAWAGYIKDQSGKLEKVKKSDDMVVRSIVLTSVYDRELDVYSIIKQSPEGIYLTAFYHNGSAYINSDMQPEAAEAAKRSLATFATNLAVEAINKQVAAEEKVLAKLEKEKAALVKTKTGYENDIAGAEDAIAKANDLIKQRTADLEKNSGEQTDKDSQISEQQKSLEDVKAKLKKY